MLVSDELPIATRLETTMNSRHLTARFAQRASKAFTVAALAVGLTATVFAPNAAFAAGSTSLNPSKPVPSLVGVDLQTQVFRLGTDVQKGENFGFVSLITNKGTMPASNVKVVIGVATAFNTVTVTDAAGFKCSSQYSASGFLPGTWITCTGGQLGAGQTAQIVVSATAGQTAGTFNMFGQVDPGNTIDEYNEGNNADSLPIRIN